MAERLKAPVSKTGILARVSRVRIPISPLILSPLFSKSRKQGRLPLWGVLRRRFVTRFAALCSGGILCGGARWQPPKSFPAGNVTVYLRGRCGTCDTLRNRIGNRSGEGRTSRIVGTDGKKRRAQLFRPSLRVGRRGNWNWCRHCRYSRQRRAYGAVLAAEVIPISGVTGAYAPVRS